MHGLWLVVNVIIALARGLRRQPLMVVNALLLMGLAAAYNAIGPDIEDCRSALEAESRKYAYLF